MKTMLHRLSPLSLLPLLSLCFFLVPAPASAVPAGDATVHDVKITCNRAPDCSSLKSIVESVTRDCKSDDERAIAIYNFGRYAWYHHAYPSESCGDVGALKMINVYGWSLCGGQHTVLAALYEAAGFKWRYRGWSNPGHTTVECFYGGRWHYLDTFLKFYCWMPDPDHPGKRTIAGQDDIKADPSLVTSQFVVDEARKVCYHKDNAFAYVGPRLNWTAPAFMDCGDDLPGVLSGIRSNNNAGSPRGWAGLKFDEPTYSTAVDLAPGYCLDLDWDKVEGAYYFRGSKAAPQHTCGSKEYRNCPDIGPLLEPYHFKGGKRTWSNGALTFKPDLHNDAFLAGLKGAENVAVERGVLKPKDAARPAVLTVEMASPYVVAKVSAAIHGDDLKAEWSADAQKWAPIDLAKLGEAVAGSYRYFVRLTFPKPVDDLEITSIVQHNQQALPYLAPGQNTITIAAADPDALKGNRLAVTYAYCLGSRSATPEQIYDEGGQIGAGQHASWSPTPTVVQTIVDKLPATISIPVPTPQGRQPVYPRMLFLRREVLAPGQAPAATPTAPATPATAAGETLATLPSPWTIGIEPPPAPPARPTKTVSLLPTKIAFVSREGEVAEQHAVRWPKDNKGAWVMLCAFDPAALPDAKSLQSAKLVVSVREAHDKAPSQAAAVLLTAPFTPGKPYDFASLGQTVGTATIGEGDGSPFATPKPYEIDVTAAVRAWARGKQADATAAGALALRVVPNRAIDDGWTVRFTPDRERPVELKILTAAGE